MRELFVQKKEKNLPMFSVRFFSLVFAPLSREEKEKKAKRQFKYYLKSIYSEWSPLEQSSTDFSLSFFLLGLEFFETSAKENINVKSVFERSLQTRCSLIFIELNCFSSFRLVDIILEKMSDTAEDPNGNGQGNNAYGNSAGAYNKGTTRLTANDQQSKGNQCQC